MLSRQGSAVAAFFRARLSTRPRPVWTLSAIDVIAAAAVIAAAFAPATMHHFMRVGIICGILLAAAAAATWALGSRLERAGLVIGVLVQVAILSAVIAEAPTPQGAMLGCLTFIWSAVYSASFFARREMYVVLAAATIGSAAALASNGIHRWLGFWVVLTVTTVTTGVVLERSVGQLRREAETDALTGLLNRRGFFKAAEVARSISERAGLVVAVVVIDLDNFKGVNDLEGHAGGDRLLVAATASWRSQLRAGDLLARFGGDEFVLLLPGLSPPEVGALVERFHEVHPIAWTSGAAFLAEGGTIEEALVRADELLYRAKVTQGGPDRSS
ncbi:MAG TPA: GGDEF domain-containing protein [Acidimicrobiales bacterium]|nr:GGDEF domain-containing protein [Acidimicrobiales bacterium]